MVGYRPLPQYTHLLPECTGRPHRYALSPLYAAPEIEGYDEVHQELYSFETPAEEKRYPGVHEK